MPKGFVLRLLDAATGSMVLSGSQNDIDRCHQKLHTKPRPEASFSHVFSIAILEQRVTQS